MGRERKGREKKGRDKQSDESSTTLDRISLALTLVVVSAFAIFAGYLVGQYAVQWVAGPLVETSRAEDPGTRLGGDDGEGPNVASSQTAGAESRPSAGASGAAAGSSGSSAGTSTSEPAPAAGNAGQSGSAGDAGTQAAPSKTRPASSPDQPTVFRVQVGRFTTRDEAAQLAERLKTGSPPIPDAWVNFDDRSGDYRVQVGAFSSRERAESFVSTLQEQGHDAYIAQ